MAPPSTEENMNGYQEHLNVVANDIGCDLRQFDRDTPGMMYVEFGYVEGPKIEGPYPPSSRYGSAQQQYVVNLHELGHFVHGHTQGRPPLGSHAWYFDNGVLHSEAEAWLYVLENMIDEPTQETFHFMWYTCLGSYFAGALAAGFTTPGQRLWNGNRHHIPFAYGEPTPLFNIIKARLMGGASGNAERQGRSQDGEALELQGRSLRM